MNENHNAAFLLNAYSFGTYENPGLEAASASRELLLREHVLTSLYWYSGKNPLSSQMMTRVDEVLPDTQSRNAYLTHYRNMGQQMKQAELEGMAVRPGTSNHMIAGAPIEAPKMHYPQLALDFIAQNYAPGMVEQWQAYSQEEPRALWPKFCDRLLARTREAVCELGVFLEYAAEDPALSDYIRVLERAIFTLVAINPIVRIGMPTDFSIYMRTSVHSFVLYFYKNEEVLRNAFKEIPESHYSQLMECLADMANLIPANRGYSEPTEDQGETLDF